jgi:hypothetical protein
MGMPCPSELRVRRSGRENGRNSIFAGGSQDLAADTTLSVEALYSSRNFESHGILDVSGEIDGQSSAGHATESAAVISLERALFGDWNAGVTGNYSAARQQENASSLAQY